MSEITYSKNRKLRIKTPFGIVVVCETELHKLFKYGSSEKEVTLREKE